MNIRRLISRDVSKRLIVNMLMTPRAAPCARLRHQRCFSLLLANQSITLITDGKVPQSMFESILTALQTVGHFLLLHPPQEVLCDLQKCLAAPPPLLLTVTIQHLLLLPLTLPAFWVIWPQDPLILLQLLLHKCDNVLLQQLEQNITWTTQSKSNHPQSTGLKVQCGDYWLLWAE